jgi:hypothetical protein
MLGRFLIYYRREIHLLKKISKSPEVTVVKGESLG